MKTMKILLVEDVGEVAKYGCFERSPKREKPAATKCGQTDEHFAEFPKDISENDFCCFIQYFCSELPFASGGRRMHMGSREEGIPDAVVRPESKQQQRYI